MGLLLPNETKNICGPDVGYYALGLSFEKLADETFHSQWTTDTPATCVQPQNKQSQAGGLECFWQT